MRNPPLVLLAALALAPLARADRFWLENPEQKDRVEGSLPAVIDGVILDQTDKQYHVRVVGGEVWLDKARVVRLEKDALTLQAITQAEAEHLKASQAAEHDARQARAAEAAAHAERQRPVDATAQPVPQPAPAPVEDSGLVYDPVLHVLRPARGIPTDEVRRELELAYQQTGDRSILKTLRILRRR
jgi:hypothetical protein